MVVDTDSRIIPIEELVDTMTVTLIILNVVLNVILWCDNRRLRAKIVELKSS